MPATNVPVAAAKPVVPTVIPSAVPIFVPPTISSTALSSSFSTLADNSLSVTLEISSASFL